MRQKNILLNSLKESFSLIWRNKSLFVLLCILQIAFFVVLVLLSSIYFTKMIENAKAMSDYIASQKLDDISVSSNILQKKSLLGDDPLAISRNFNEMVKNFKIYLIYIFVLLIIFTSINWTITYRLIKKSHFRDLIKIFSKILIASLLYLGLVFLFFFLLFDISFTQISIEGAKLFSKYIPFLIFSAILAYFMFISLSLASSAELKNIIQKTLRIGLKKAHYIFVVYFINIFLFVFLSSLMYYFLEKNFLVLFLSLILLVFSFAFGRIFLVNVAEKLEKS